MLRSDWSFVTCLPHDLQMLLVILESFLEIAEVFVADANVAVCPAFAVLIPCENRKFQRISNAAI